eukprot:scpid104889/ scgid12354/ 
MSQAYGCIPVSGGESQQPVYGEQVPTRTAGTAAAKHGTSPITETTAYYTGRTPATERYGERQTLLVRDTQDQAASAKDEEEDYLKEFICSDFEDVIREQPGTQILATCRTVNKMTYTWSKLIW